MDARMQLADLADKLQQPHKSDALKSATTANFLNAQTRDLSCRLDKKATKILVQSMKLFSEFPSSDASINDVETPVVTPQEQWCVHRLRSLLMHQHGADRALVDSVMKRKGQV
ncbi:hypothetical protein SeMB42_g07018 [Synchytrium endobioticum]|uniref:Uncharacterized protein n=1 Tax=Synchytrium endobioticum TaxID=286115 RepID=A0A507D0A3_9FUNG|nr:hypothetical protein SeMB42_g07018 [Synchytrium endobioticum]TPX44909.1 hypothetical protein SeLEV6574_g04194 [Synchytrium endobioticum]